MPKRMQIIKTGKYLASDGTPVEFKKSDLLECAESYDPASTWKAPLVIGHPEREDQAYGWIDKLKVEGNSLIAELSQVAPELEQAMREGRYRNHSASFYMPTNPYNPRPGKIYLKHVGILGAYPPVVKGLQPLQFAEGSVALTIEFAEGDLETRVMYRINDIQLLFEKLKLYIAEKEGAERAEQMLPDYQVVSLRMERLPNPATVAFAESNQEKNIPIEESNIMTEQEAKALQEENAALRRENSEAKERLARAGIAQFAEEKLVKTGKLTPAQKERFVELAVVVDRSGGTAEFAEPGATEKKTALDLLKEFAESLNVQQVPSAGAGTYTKEKAVEPETVEFAEGDIIDPSEH